MNRFRLMLGAGALAIAVAGCAGPSTGSKAGRSAVAPVSFADTGLVGAWRGYFIQTAAVGDSRMIHGDYTFQIADDGTYTGTRTVRLVAGSSRGGQSKISGHVVVKGNRVMLDDDSGWRMTLVRKGETLYGVNADPATMWPISIEMEKASSTAKGTEAGR